jgi:hypothetical protein
VAAVLVLPACSCLIDGEAIVSDDSGLAVFELIRSFRHDHAVVLCAFDLLELDGQDLRRLPIEQRKQTLVRLLHGPYPGMALNEHYVGRGDIVYQQACKLGCEVSCRSGSARSIGQADRSNGSRSRTRRRRRYGARQKNNGVEPGPTYALYLSSRVKALLATLRRNSEALVICRQCLPLP